MVVANLVNCSHLKEGAFEARMREHEEENW